jgi:glycerate 2-kinase
MKSILIAPDKFKGTMSANEFCQAVESSLRQKWPGLKLVSLPLSDGGEGFLDTMVKTADLSFLDAPVHDPLGRQIVSKYLHSPDDKRVFIESAIVCGMQLLQKNEYNCLITNTFGLGQMLNQIFESDVREVFIGIGGTATCDAGSGMALALGYRFLDSNDREIVPMGKNLRDIQRIIPPSNINWQQIKVTGLCDVGNPMHGTNGAAHVFARQKGADDDGIQVLDEGLMNMAQLMEKDLGISVQNMTGSGAGGALGAGLIAFLGAKLISGSAFVLQQTGFYQKLEVADLVITGEGRLDDQSLNGKLCYAVGNESKKAGKPVIAIVGSNQLEDSACFDEIISLEAQASGELDPFRHAALLTGQLATKAVEKRKIY